MIKLKLPSKSVSDSVAACAPHIQNNDLAARLISSTDSLVLAESGYESIGAVNGWPAQIPSDNMGLDVDADEIKSIYKNNFSKLGKKSRAVYNSILVGVRMCPMCGARPPFSLDHYLPQSKFPLYTLTPKNLVPACAECNKKKTDKHSNKLEDFTFHPYFETVPSSAPWLFSEVIEGSSSAIVFQALPPADWGDLMQARIRNQFGLLGLADLYAAKAAHEMAEIAFLLEVEFELGGISSVRSYLANQAISRRSVSLNSWTAALYEGLSCSLWYVSGGFRTAV